MSCLLGRKGCVIADELKCCDDQCYRTHMMPNKTQNKRNRSLVLPRFDKKKMFKCDFDEESKTKEGKESDWLADESLPYWMSSRRFRISFLLLEEKINLHSEQA
ncbi:hypothetical protein H0E87_030009 [Populus deltoides]|uniref:Uncharacterized protein n=1 Tax=Populus deltoides TaxID=3696 RepID=A0A8T2WPR3_POPDE|nr:hypothetical protein H0E87_030009 [Populus deltoides]